MARTTDRVLQGKAHTAAARGRRWRVVARLLAASTLASMLLLAVFSTAPAGARVAGSASPDAGSTKSPKITQQPVSVTVEEGATVVFEAAASGIPAPSVQWETLDQRWRALEPGCAGDLQRAHDRGREYLRKRASVPRRVHQQCGHCDEQGRRADRAAGTQGDTAAGERGGRRRPERDVRSRRGRVPVAHGPMGNVKPTEAARGLLSKEPRPTSFRSPARKPQKTAISIAPCSPTRPAQRRAPPRR